MNAYLMLDSDRLAAGDDSAFVSGDEAEVKAEGRGDRAAPVLGWSDIIELRAAS